MHAECTAGPVIALILLKSFFCVRRKGVTERITRKSQRERMNHVEVLIVIHNQHFMAACIVLTVDQQSFRHLSWYCSALNK